MWQATFLYFTLLYTTQSWSIQRHVKRQTFEGLKCQILKTLKWHFLQQNWNTSKKKKIESFISTRQRQTEITILPSSTATHSREQDRQSARSSRRRLRRCRSRRRKDPPVGEQRPVSGCRVPSELRRTAVEDAVLRQVAESPLDLEEFSERRRPAVFSAELPPPPAVIPPPLRRRLLAPRAARVVVSGDGSGGVLPAGRYSDGDLGEVYAH